MKGSDAERSIYRVKVIILPASDDVVKIQLAVTPES